MATPAVGEDYRAKAREAALRHSLDPNIFLRLIHEESRFNPRAVNPKSGAIGLGQLMPGTAADLGVDPNDPDANLDGSARYLKEQLDQFGDYPRALAAYNAGPGNVEKHGGIPPFDETRQYVSRVAGARAKNRTVADLGRAMKQKYPNVARYQSLSDDSLGVLVKSKYPQYAWISDTAAAAPAAAPAAPVAAAPAAAPPQGLSRVVPQLRATPEGLPELAGPGSPPEFVRGFKGGLTGQNVEAVGRLAQAVGIKGPGGALVRAGQARAQAPKVASFRDVKSPEALFDYLQFQAGQAIASTIPSVAGAAVGTAVGGAVGGPVGATVGGIAGAGVPGYALNFGDVAEEVDLAAPDATPEQRAQVSALIAVPISALDVIPSVRFGGKAAKKLLVKKVVDEAAKRGLIQRFLAGGLKGGTLEGLTESLQETIQALSVAGTAGKPVSMEELAVRAVDAGIGGALGGGLIGGAVEAIPQRQPPPPPPEPTAAERRAARKNIETPATLPDNLREVGEKASLQLGAVLEEMQKRGPITFKGGGVEILDAHIVPGLTRYFPREPNPVRVTVVDKVSGKMHSVALPSISSLWGTISPGPRPLPPGLERPPEKELPGPTPIQPKTTLPEGRIISPEQFQGVLADAKARAAEEQDRIRKVGATVVQGVPEALGRIRTAPDAIAALERQIAERPGDKNVKRWRRRLEKLKALPGPPAMREAPEPEPTGRYDKVPLSDLVQRISKAKSNTERKRLVNEINLRLVGVSPAESAAPADATRASSWTKFLKEARANARANPTDVTAQDAAFRAEQNFEAWKKREQAKKAPAAEQPRKTLPPTQREEAAPAPAKPLRGVGKIIREPTPEEAVKMKPGETVETAKEIIHRLPVETERRIAATARRTAGATSLEGGAPAVEEKRKAPGRREEDVLEFKKGLAEAERHLARVPKWTMRDLKSWWAVTRPKVAFPTQDLAEARKLIGNELESIVKHGNEILGPPATFAGSMRKGKWTPAGEIGKPKAPRVVGTVTAAIKEKIEKADPGDCFRASRKWAASNPGSVLVHGKLTVQGERFDHAWVEVDGDVVDPAVGARFDKAEFYAKMKAEPDAKYEGLNATALAVKTKHNGPWTKEEAAGRFIEHNGAPPALAPGSRPAPAPAPAQGVEDVKHKTSKQAQAVADTMPGATVRQDRYGWFRVQLPKQAPAPKAPRRELGQFERGDLVTAKRGYSGRGFVLGLVPKTGEEVAYTPPLYRVRWENGHETKEFAKALKVRVGSPRATEEQMKRIEAAPEPQSATYLVGGKRVEPEPRPEIETQVMKEVEEGEGLRPIKELSLKPTKGFRADDAMATKKYFSDAHVLFVASEMDPKVRESVAVMASGIGKRTPSEEMFEKTIAHAIAKGPVAHLEARGWAHIPSQTRPDDVAALYDPQADRLVVVDAQKLKYAIKAVSPDSYEQLTDKPHNAVVLRRGGKLVGLIMPMKHSEGEAETLRKMLGVPPKPVVNEARASGAPTKPRTAAALPARGIPIARKAPAIPTEEEAKTLPEAPVPPLPPEMKKGPIAKVVETVREMIHEFVAITNPVRFAVGPNLDVLMRGKGGLKRALFRTERAQEKVRVFWEKRSKEQVLDFWNRLETGSQPDKRLAEIAALYRERADNMFKAISRYKEIPYWENWFPHIWKNRKQAETFFRGRRPMEGRKSFLKKRLITDINAGLAAGLEPVSWNPEEIMQAAEHNARKYVMVQELLKDYLKLGSMQLVRIGQKPPDNFRRLDQNWSKLYLNPETEIKEAFDRKLMEGLQSVARAIGVKHQRKVKLGYGGALGYSEKGRASIFTRFATPESVLAHEMGHAIDDKYGLKEAFIRKSTPAEKKELRALADLRFEGESPSKHHKAYVRSGSEKMAVMLQALIHAPQAFKETAPLNYKKFIAFLADKPELAPLVHLRPSLTFGGGTATIHAGGAVLGGEYWAEENLARLLDNHMSRDFINETRLGRSIMDSRNSLNAINLGLSGFHATGTTLLAMMHRLGIGISLGAHGVGNIVSAPFTGGRTLGLGLKQVAAGVGKAVTFPIAPLMYAREGWKFFRGAPELAAIEEILFTAGASLERKQYYRNQLLDRFVRNSRQALSEGTPYERLGGAAKAVAQLPFAAIEAPMRALTNYYIPQMKVAAFRDLFSSQMQFKKADIAAGKTSEADVARIAWRDVEDRFGLINYDNEFWHNTLKSSIMVLIRAPGWTLGTLRGLGGAAFADFPRFAARAIRGKAPEWTSRMSDALAMTFITMAFGGIYHWLHTGKKPKTLEDLLHPQNGLLDEQGRPMRINFPTFFKDVEGWARDPLKALLGRKEHGRGESTIGLGGKLAPEVTLVHALLTNQSYRGPIRNVRDPAYEQAGQVIRYIFGREQPFSISQTKQILKGGGEPLQAVEGFWGITQQHKRREGQRPFRYREVEQ